VGKKILVTGACGQIGSELTLALRKMYGQTNVIASDIAKPSEKLLNSGPFELLDCTDGSLLEKVVKKFNLNTIYHLVTILSAASEKDPQRAWNVNIKSLHNVLEVARQHQCSVFAASSPAVFGPTTPKDKTPQDTILKPTNIYGITKVAGELLCDYYYQRFGIDTRGLRFSGVISYETIPEGGITDYAVEMFYEALKHKRYTCFLREGTYLPFMYITDAVKAAIKLMEANPEGLKHRNAFNVAAVSFAPEDLAREIQKYIPDFVIDYHVSSVHQSIADSGTNSLDDSAAREEWGWEPEYDLPAIAKDMIEKISMKLNTNF
jgi:nucleoside-diphosphate-sugar epimerase